MFFVIRGQESEANIMVWAVFVIRGQESQANIMVWAVCSYQKSGD